MTSTPVRRPSASTIGVGLLLLAAICWGAGNVAQKTVLDDIGPYTANGITSLIGSLVLLPISVRERAHTRRLGFRGVALLLLVSTLFTAAATLTQIGYGGTSVTNAGFMVNTATVLAPLCAWLILRERPHLLVYPALLLTMAGIFTMSFYDMTALAWGDSVCLSAAVLFGLWIPLVGKFVTRHGLPAYLTAMSNLLCGIACLTMAFVYEPLSWGAVRNCLPQILLLGVLSKGVAYVLMASAQQHVPAAIAAILVSTEAVFGAGFAAVLLGESLSSLGLIGASLVACGSLIVNCAGTQRPDCNISEIFAHKQSEPRDSIAGLTQTMSTSGVAKPV